MANCLIYSLNWSIIGIMKNNKTFSLSLLNINSQSVISRNWSTRSTQAVRNARWVSTHWSFHEEWHWAITSTSLMYIWSAVMFKVMYFSYLCFVSENNFLMFLLFESGRHDWGQEESTGSRRCPMCLEVGPVVTLCMGIEPAFYVDSGPPTYAFNPCGHMATEKTVK